MATDWFNRATGRTGPLPDGMPFSKIFSLGHIDGRIQKHLQKVYTTLAVALLVAAAGVTADVAYHMGGALTTMGAFASLAALALMAPTQQNLGKRLGALMALSFCQGASMGPLVSLALDVNPGLLLMAAVCTSLVFVCFSASALLTQRRSYLFLGGWLSSALMGLLSLRLGAWLLPSVLGRLVFEAELFVGLAVFAGYVIFDTQVIVERCGAGDYDYVKHAADLFLDAAAVFVRVLVILLRNAERREQEEDRRRSRRRRA